MRSSLLPALIAVLCLTPAPSDGQTSSSGGTAGAQSSPRGATVGTTIRPASPRQPGRPSRPARPPQPGVPLVPPAPPSAPPIGPFALPSTLPIGPFASPSPLDRDVFRASPRTYSRSRGFFLGVGGYAPIVDGYGYGFAQPESSSPVLDRYMRQQQEETGYLRLDVEPESAQVYVDGLYAGTVADFRRSGGRPLGTGPHRVEIRAEGYDSQSVELQIRANDVLSYRGTLNRREAPAQRVAAAAPPKTFYVIPRCYAGTSRPRADQLPPGCRLADVREVPPTVSEARPAR